MAYAASVIWVFVTSGVLIYGSKFVPIKNVSNDFSPTCMLNSSAITTFSLAEYTFLSILSKKV